MPIFALCTSLFIKHPIHMRTWRHMHARGHTHTHPHMHAHVHTQSCEYLESRYACDCSGCTCLNMMPTSAPSVTSIPTVSIFPTTSLPSPVPTSYTIGWATHTITTSADGAVSVFGIDVDGDGDVDVLSASRDDDTIAWYEDADGGVPHFGETECGTRKSVFTDRST